MARRQWTIDSRDYDSEDAFRDAVAAELARLENIGHRMGGAFVATPVRVEMSPDVGQAFTVGGEPIREFQTLGWVFTQEFMPAARRPEPTPEPELEPVGDA